MLPSRSGRPGAPAGQVGAPGSGGVGAGRTAERHHGRPVGGGGRSDGGETGDGAAIGESGRRRLERRSRRDDVVDDEHTQSVEPGAGTKARAADSLGTGSTGLRIRRFTFEEAATRDTELTGDDSREALGLVEAALMAPRRAGRRPGDDVDVMVEAPCDQAVDQQPGQVAADRTAVAVLPAEDDIPGPAGERDGSDDLVRRRARGGTDIVLWQ